MNKSSGKYKLIYTKTAIKDIKKLDPVSRKKIKKKLEIYSNKPFKYARKLIKFTLGSYRWRMGNHRVVFDVKGKTIIVLRVGHRKEVYQ